MDGEIVNVGPAYHSYVVREALGVVGVILPWNAPLHQAARAIAPALVELARLAVEVAGLPPGVLNVIVGQGTVLGPAMVDDADLVPGTAASGAPPEHVCSCRRAFTTSLSNAW